MKRKYLLLICIALTGCGGFKMDKPFIVVEKMPNPDECPNHCGYVIEDIDGTRSMFCEDFNKYNIGDTIK